MSARTRPAPPESRPCATGLPDPRPFATGPQDPRFWAGPVIDLARELVGWTVAHAGASGRIVETEAYHDSEPACHAHVGRTPRTEVLFGPPGGAYVYRSYGIHALLNVVVEPEGVGAAVLLRALEPLDGVELMRTRRGLERPEDLCSGPGKLTQALAIDIELNGSDLATGPIRLTPPDPRTERTPVTVGPRIGITKAAELPWRFCEANSRFVSRPRPPGDRARRAA
ncbi:MAG: DNA-3-methyladenine glycosylase [Solirubrobacteraceae bacterium]